MKAFRRSSAPPDVPTLFAQWKNEQAASTLTKVTDTVREEDENSEPPSDFGSEPSSPPESDSEPESDPPEDFDETPPESDFDDEPSTEPNSFMDDSFIDSLIDDSFVDESFIDDDDDNLTLPSMSTGTMQRFMVGDADDDLLPDFESDGEFDDYVFDDLSEPEDEPESEPETGYRESTISLEPPWQAPQPSTGSYQETHNSLQYSHYNEDGEGEGGSDMESPDRPSATLSVRERRRTALRPALLAPSTGHNLAEKMSSWNPPEGAVSLTMSAPLRRGPVPVPASDSGRNSVGRRQSSYQEETESDTSTQQISFVHSSASVRPLPPSTDRTPPPPPLSMRSAEITHQLPAPSPQNGGLPPPPPSSSAVALGVSSTPPPPPVGPPAPPGAPPRRSIGGTSTHASPGKPPSLIGTAVGGTRTPPPPLQQRPSLRGAPPSPPPPPLSSSVTAPPTAGSAAVSASPMASAAAATPSSPVTPIHMRRPPPPPVAVAVAVADRRLSLEVSGTAAPAPVSPLELRSLPSVDSQPASPFKTRALPPAPVSPFAAAENKDESITTVNVPVPLRSFTPSPPPSPRVELDRIGRPIPSAAHTADAADPASPLPIAALMPHELIAVSQHETYSKYFKMLKVGIPKPMVQKKMRDEGVNDMYLDLKPDEMVPILETANTIAAYEHPLYKKYFKMLKVGLPLSVVKEKMEAEGFDSYVMDLSPDHLVSLNDVKKYDPNSKNTAKNAVAPVSQGKKKRLFIQGLDASKLGDDSLWANDGHDEDIDLDKAELERLFLESRNSSPVTRAGARPGTAPSATQTKNVVLIDPKRAQNAAISLARIKWPFHQLREKILYMDDDGLSVEQLLSLRDYLPTHEEVRALSGFAGEVSSLGPAERYMHAMLNLPEGKSRITCMIFRQQFASQVHGCKAQLCQLELACDDVKTCARLKKVLKTILKVGNQMQGGASHVGLSIESLLKLQNTKAFDKKTSVLQYVICIIAKQDADSLLFVEDVASINIASKISLDLVLADKTGLRRELDQNLQFLASLPPASPSQNGAEMRKMHDFLTVKATHQCDDLDKRYAKVSAKYGHLLAYFGEDSALPCQEFFTLLGRFVADFVTVRDQVHNSLKAEARKSNSLNNLSKRQSTGKVVTQAMLAEAEAQGLQMAPPLKSRPSLTPEKDKDASPEKALSRRPSSVRMPTGDAVRRRSELRSSITNTSPTTSSSHAADLTSSPVATKVGVINRRSSRRNDGILPGRSSTTPSTIALIQAQVAMQVQLESDSKPQPPPQRPPPPPKRPPPPA